MKSPWKKNESKFSLNDKFISVEFENNNWCANYVTIKFILLNSFILTLDVSRGGYLLPNHSLLHEKEKKGNLSVVSNLLNILGGYFNDKQIMGTATESRVCRRRPVNRTVGCHIRILRITIFKTVLLVLCVWSENLLCTLRMSFSSFMSNNLGEILIFWTFWRHFQFLHLFTVNQQVWCRPCFYNVIVTSQTFLCDVIVTSQRILFGMYEKRRPKATLW